MATYRGMDGSVTIAAAVVGEIKSWSVNTGVETLESTSMGLGWRTFVGGLAQWTGQATANLDYGDTTGQKAIVDRVVAATPLSTGAAMVFRQSATKTWSGSALVNQIGINQQLGAIVEVSFSFQGTGALALAWA